MQGDSVNVPRVAGHTLTLVNSSIVLIGGFSPYNTSNTRVYVYDLHKAAWVVMRTEGSKPTGTSYRYHLRLRSQNMIV